MNIDWQGILTSMLHWITTEGVKVVIALAILFISMRVINFVAKRVSRHAEKKKLDKTLASTLIYIGKVALKVVVIVCLVGYVGIDTSGITALITSLGVCVGLAVNGTLSNLAGGAMIIITRPFRIDDFVEIGGVSGTVEEIHIVNTKLRTPDNKVVYIPNGTASTSTVVNYSEKGTRRLDLEFSVAYGCDYDRAFSLLEGKCEDNEHILKDPAPSVTVSDHGDHGVTLSMKVWVNSSDYWSVRAQFLKETLTDFEQNGIEIPFNQLEVRVLQ